MGVTGDLLPRILRTAGRKIDLSTYKDGIIESSPKNDKSKRQRTSSRRPLRIGLDVGTMIARAAHGHGSMLLDERHLTNYGRSLLQAEANATEPPAEDSLQAMTSDENRREYVDRCAGYVMKRIQTLQNVSGAELLVVFDGATPPIKDDECIKRSEKRKKAAQERDEPLDADEAAGANTKRRVRAARRAGAGKNHGDILVEVMQGLRKAKISFMVAPYEADGQLAYLSEKGMVDLVVTEDSDLIAHGCNSIVYKTIEGLGKGVAEGILVQREDLGAMGMVQKSLSLEDFSTVMLAVMFVALGCDYCSSLKQIGSVAARDIVRRAFHGEKGQSIEEREKPALEKLFGLLYQQTSETLTDEAKRDYENSFLEALLMYRHPIIYDPFAGKCVLLRNPPHCSDPELMDYEPYARLCNDARRREQILGTCHGPTMSTRILEGWVNPRTKRPHENMHIPPSAREVLSLSASESDGDSNVETQDFPSTAAESQADYATQGPDTQGMSHIETQLEMPGQNTPGSAIRGPDTQDMSRVDSQVGTPSRDGRGEQARVTIHEATFQKKTLGLLLDPNLVILKVIDEELVEGTVNAGDKIVAINGSKIAAGTTVSSLKELVLKLPRPLKMSFSRLMVEDEAEGITATSSPVDDAVNSTIQSSLTGSSSSRFGSQPSQFSAESQVSPDVRSPNLLDSQPS